MLLFGTSGNASCEQDWLNYMSGKCTKESCRVVQDGICAEGRNTLDDCPYYTVEPLEALLNQPGASEGTIDRQTSTQATSDAFRSGVGLGLDEVRLLMAKHHSDMIGILGLPGSGKTSYLMGLYSLIINLRLIPEFLFAGSWTLPGFEQRAAGLRQWKDGSLESRIVPRTSSSTREPAFLHLNLKDTSGIRPLSLLFSDVPGEWFDKFISKPSDVRDKVSFILDCSY